MTYLIWTEPSPLLYKKIWVPFMFVEFGLFGKHVLFPLFLFQKSKKKKNTPVHDEF